MLQYVQMYYVHFLLNIAILVRSESIATPYNCEGLLFWLN